MPQDDEQPARGVSCAVESGLATITLETPSLTAVAKKALVEAVERVASDDAVRAVVLTGTGRVFCAGQDLGEHAQALETDSSTSFATITKHYNPVITALTTMPKPVVAAINGSCAGAGLSLALACDVRIAVAGARFTTAFTAIGLTFDSGLSASLSRAIGAARASELILLSEPFTAEQAADWGLVGRVVPPEDFSDTVATIAGTLAAGPTVAYAAAKQAMQQAWAAPLPEVLMAEGKAQSALGLTRDHQDAVGAFLAKRSPTFTGS